MGGLLFIAALILLEYSHGFVFVSPRSAIKQPALFAQAWKSSTSSNPNVDLDGVKNLRDLSTAFASGYLGIGMVPGKIIRTGCPSKASEADLQYLYNVVGVKDLIDLRSPKEWREDSKLFEGTVYRDYDNYRYSKIANGWVKLVGNTTRFRIFSGSGLGARDEVSVRKKKRYFISLMSERKILTGTFNRLRKRTRWSLLALGAASIASSRARKKVRSILLDKINGGGLSLLNEILLDGSGKEIVAVMKLLALGDGNGSNNSKSTAAAVYCTAGKDRTGLIMMLVLSVLGASDSQILADYIHSDSAYADINSDDAMVMSMSQRDIDPSVFLRAPPTVIVDTLQYIRSKYGGVNRYLNKNGFTDVWRNKLRNSLLS